MDVNGDGGADIVKSKAGATDYVYLNNGNGWSSAFWTIPVDFVDSSSKDLGIRLVDVNGDGLVDILQGTSSTKKAWLGNGSGWVEYTNWEPPIAFIDGSNQDVGVRFADVNGDGLVDIMEQDDNAWLNTGSEWINSPGWISPEEFIVSGKNVGRRLADVNGDGFVDVVVSSSSKYTWTKNQTTPYMLKSITNEFGGVTIINYTTSTQFNNTNLGFNIFVVSNVSKNNSLGAGFNAAVSTGYEYALGKYNYGKQEFRGFGIKIGRASCRERV